LVLLLRSILLILHLLSEIHIWTRNLHFGWILDFGYAYIA